MATINAVAHVNELTKDVKNDYYLTPQVTATLTVKEVIDRLRAREIATKNVDGPAFIQTFLDECAKAAAEGNNIVTSFFRSSIGIQGVVYDYELGHNIPAQRLKVSVNLTQGEGAKRAVENAVIYSFEQPAATGPIIQSVSDPTLGISDRLTPGAMALIQGMRLSIKGDDTKVGITFYKVTDGVAAASGIRILPAKIYPNTPSKLQFTLPAEVVEGDWAVEVTTQASSNSASLLKTPRSYRYPKTVKVDDGADRPDIV